MVQEPPRRPDGHRSRPPGVGETLPDLILPDHTGRLRHLSEFTAPTAVDRHTGLDAGHPVVLVFYRGAFCPRDQQQLTELVSIQQQLRVSYVQLVSVSTDPPHVAAAHRSGLGATWTFLCDSSRRGIGPLGLLDATEGEYAYPSRPFTYVLTPGLRVHSCYDGWFFVGRPTPHELRSDLREVLSTLPHGNYEAYLQPDVQRVRIPQQVWRDSSPELGVSGRPVAEGTVSGFDRNAGSGAIRRDGDAEEVFFNFTALPGSGYRTIDVGTRVRFEIIETPGGYASPHVMRLDPLDRTET